MIHSLNRILPMRSACEEDSGRVQYWVIWSLGQRNKFISHPTTAIRQLTFGHQSLPRHGEGRTFCFYEFDSGCDSNSPDPMGGRPVAEYTAHAGRQAELDRARTEGTGWPAGFNRHMEES